MTVETTISKSGPYAGAGTAGPFLVDFRFLENAHLQVLKTSAAGVDTVLTLDVDYLVSGAGAETGEVSLPGLLAVGEQLTIVRNVPATQEADYVANDPFPSASHEEALDKLTMIAQQQGEVLDRTLKFPASDLPTSTVLPNIAARSGRVLTFGEGGDPIPGPSVGDVGTVLANIAKVGVVADNIVDVTTVADSIASVNTVATNIAAVVDVGDSIVNVNAVAGSLADVQTVADNIADVSTFAGVYYGPSAVDPTLRRDGTPLQVGDLYFNTASNSLRAYGVDAAWVEGASGAVNVYNFSGDGVTKTFDLPIAPGNENVTQVYISGVYQQKNVYSVVGAVLSLDAAPSLGVDNIEVVTFSVLPIGETDASLVSFPGGRNVADLADDSDAAHGDAMVAVKQPFIGSVARTQHDKNAERLSVKDFGAVGDGSADDAPAFQAAVDAIGAAGGGVVYVPAGSYKLGATITNSAYNFVNIEGAGRNVTHVFGSVSTLPALFKIGGGASGPFRCGIRGMSLSNAQIGIDVNSGATNTYLDDMVIDANLICIRNVGDYTTSPVHGNQGTHLNKLELSGFASSAIYNYCASELYWDEIVIGGAWKPGCVGINLDSASNAVYAARANILACEYGMLIQDAAGISPNPTGVISVPSQMWFSQILGDTSIAAGIHIEDGFEFNLFDCWGSGSTNGHGIVVGSAVKEISIVGARALGNAKHGLLLNGSNPASRIKVVGGMFACNGYASTNGYDGIYVGAGLTDFSIVGAQCYNDSGIGLGVTQRYGVNVETGGSDNFVISGCVNTNNLSGGMRDASTGLNKQIFGNVPKEDNAALFVGNSGAALRGLFAGSTSWDPGSCPDGAINVVGLSVPGAAVGMTAIASFTGITGAGWLISASITGAGSAAVTLMNKTGADADLGAGTLRVTAFRAE